MKAKFHVEDNARPVYCKARSVPLALRSKVDSELERLERTGVIEPVEFSEWAAPIVPILKADGSVRICGDYKVTINQAVHVDKYPIPTISDLYAQLTGGQVCSKLDLSHAYQQVVLDADSQALTTINTQKGLYQYKRLCFGVSSAPGIFQRVMEQILQGVPMTVVYLDDVLVTGKTPEEHDQNLRTVLTRMQEAGIRLKRSKCEFHQTSVTYLGHVIDSTGIHPTEDKVKAIVDAPVPQNAQELRSFLGLLHFYHHFLRNLSSLLAPLNACLQKESDWTWGPSEQQAFNQAKELVVSSQLLVHYDPTLPIIVTCDASPYGVGSVLWHKMADGKVQPVAFASRTLSAAEKNYAHLDREGLTLVFGVTNSINTCLVAHLWCRRTTNRC